MLKFPIIVFVSMLAIVINFFGILYIKDVRTAMMNRIDPVQQMVNNFGVRGTAHTNSDVCNAVLVGDYKKAASLFEKQGNHVQAQRCMMIANY